MSFVEFPKIARWSRDICITEKLDGTNAQVAIGPVETPDFVSDAEPLVTLNGFNIYAGSRNRWIVAEKSKDNYGFARWTLDHAEELLALGVGRHYGEWWGNGIQRGYGLSEKRFSLFNVSRWVQSGKEHLLPVDSKAIVAPVCCSVVPILYDGPNNSGEISRAMTALADHGSVAAPGYSDPEGIVIYHTAGNRLFKKTLTGDESPKSKLKVAA
jgi:hypothetical protein